MSRLAAMPPPIRSDAFEWKQEEWGWTLVCRALAVRHGWTARAPGADARDQPRDPEWTRIAAAAGIASERVVHLTQVHGAQVLEVAGEPPKSRREGDALVSRDPRLLLGIRVADCVPLLIGDRVTGAVAAVHAGWRGTSAGVAGAAAAAMTRAFGSRPEDLVAGLGPSIGPCCYETGPVVRDELHRAGWADDRIESWFGGPGSRHFNLWRANRDQLVRAGLSPEAVFVSALCTACHLEWFYSYRREGQRAGRLGAYIRAAAVPW